MINSLLIVVAINSLLLGIFIGYKYEHNRTLSIKAEYKLFVANINAKGEAAVREVAVKMKEYERVKHDQESIYQAHIATLNSDIKRLRYKTNTSRSYLPEIARSAKNFNRICFDRTKLDQSIREFDTRVQGLIEKGDTDRIGLSIAKDWIKELK